MGLVSSLIVLLLSGCGGAAPGGPTPAPSVAAFPTPLPTATLRILSSDELYADDDRHIGETSPRYASLPAGAVLPPLPLAGTQRGVTVNLAPRTILEGELYARGLERRPGILIVGADVAAWGALPLKLAEAGFSVLVLEINSQTPARLLETMLRSLIAVPQVDAGRIGLIGEARAADLALLSCAVNSLCDALALFSPQARQSSLNMMPSFGERPLWLAASRHDAESYRTASALAEAAPGAAQLVELSREPGAALLDGEPNLADRLVDWLAAQLRTE